MKTVGIGAGPAGLYFAILMKLQDPGHDVTLLERHTSGVTRGFGVTLSASLLRQLHREDPVSARQIEQASFHCSGQVVDVEGVRVCTTEGAGYAITRHRLLSILASRAEELGVRMEFGREVSGLAQLPAADLTVIGDGANSRVRQEAGVFQTRVRVSRNKVIWLRADKEFPEFTFAFARTSNGWLWAAACGNGEGTSTFNVECSAATWAGLGFDAVPVRDCLKRLEEVFGRQLGGQRLFAQEHGSEQARWLSVSTVTNQRWHHGSMVLAGDAAHATHFSIGSGTTLAIEDAIALAGSLRQHGELGRALAAYERQRQAALAPRQTDARFSSRWLENVPRYISLPPHQFARLMWARRSPLVARLPPRMSYLLLRASDLGGLPRSSSSLMHSLTGWLRAWLS
jgi:2-polyprenyl-6-methoxyphenol hydroxylase-like FAD-dependent oxidoreductase